MTVTKVLIMLAALVVTMIGFVMVIGMPKSIERFEAYNKKCTERNMTMIVPSRLPLGFCVDQEGKVWYFK